MGFSYKHGSGVLLVLLVAGGLLLSPDVVIKRLGTFLSSPFFPLFLVGIYLVRSLVALPVTALAVLVGFNYGLLVGFPVALAGSVMSTYVPYALARYTEFGSGLIEQAEDVAYDFFDATGDLRGVITVRIAPVPAQTTSVAAGAAPIPTRTYLLGTAVGEIPSVGAAVIIGTSLHRLTVPDVSSSPWLIAGTAVATLVLLAGPAYSLLTGDDEEEWPAEDDSNAISEVADR
jgi:uncharacterized membrane protein YdjX (TVP38/TMEM64 family)